MFKCNGNCDPFHQLAEVMHKYGGICFVDFSASAPYVKMDMHPDSSMQHLDGIFFSPHKFLGGSGTMGVAIVSKKVLQTKTPDRPGGGTVNWTNPWEENHTYRMWKNEKMVEPQGFYKRFERH